MAVQISLAVSRIEGYKASMKYEVIFFSKIYSEQCPLFKPFFLNIYPKISFPLCGANFGFSIKIYILSTIKAKPRVNPVSYP